MQIAKQLAIFLENRPGMLASVCDALAEAKINIYAISTSDTVDHSVVRMVLNDWRKALEESPSGRRWKNGRSRFREGTVFSAVTQTFNNSPGKDEFHESLTFQSLDINRDSWNSSFPG